MDSRTIYCFYSAQRLDLFAWCVRLSQLYVGFRTHLKSLHFHLFIHSFHFTSRAATSTRTSATSVVNQKRFLLVKYSKLSASSYHFNVWCSCPVIFGLCEVVNGRFCCSLGLAGYRLAGCSHFSVTVSCQPACGLYSTVAALFMSYGQRQDKYSRDL